MGGAEWLSRGAGRVLGVGLLMAVHAYWAFDAMLQTTPTCDEVHHLAAGKSYLAYGDFRMYAQNPPFSRMLAAAACRLRLPDEANAAWRAFPADRWRYGFDVQQLYDGDAPARAEYLGQFNRARIVTIVWSALTIPVVFWWGQWWFGAWSAWVAATLYAFCPHMLAFAGLIATDLPATSASFMAAFAFARWLDGPSGVRSLAAGALLGLALLCKFSALGLVLAFPVWAAVHPLLKGAGPERLLARLNPVNLFTTRVGRQFCAFLFAAWFVLNSGYFWQGRMVRKNGQYSFAAGFTRLDEFPFVSAALTRPRDAKFPVLSFDEPWPAGDKKSIDRVELRVNRFRGGPLGWVRVPLPYMFLAGFDDQKLESEGGYQQYFRGQLQDRGWKEYYLYALALKTPLGTLLLAGLGFLGAFWFRDLPAGRYFVILALALLPVALMTFGTDINLGLRYVLPTYPFLFLLAGAFARHGRSAGWMALLVPLVGWNVLSVWRTHPHELAYFNGLAGAPEKYSEWLIDSNLDWGQGLRPLASWIEEHPEWREAKVAYWGAVPPRFESAFVGTKALWDPLPPPRSAPERWFERAQATAKIGGPWRLWPGEQEGYAPQAGKYIVSANYFRGHQHPLATPGAWLPGQPGAPTNLLSDQLGPIRMKNAPQGCFAWLQLAEKPLVMPEVGPSLLFFDIGVEEAERMRKAMSPPPGPPANSAGAGP